MYKLTTFCAVLLLAGCATPDVRTQTVTVEVPVTVHCLNAADVPPIPKTSMRKDGDVRQNAAGAAADVLALQSYAEKADALLRSCATTAKEKP